MVRSRLGLKALGLCALVLGLMACIASSAQAEPKAFWHIKNLAETELFQIPNGPGGVTNLQPLLVIKELENKTGTLEFKTKGGVLVKILCTSAAFDEGGNLLAEGTISLGRLHFEGCTVELNKEPAPGCKAHTLGKTTGNILTEKATGLILLDKLISGEIDDLVMFTPDPVEGVESKIFAKIEMGEECAIGTKVNVETSVAPAAGGAFWLKDCEGNKSFLEEKVEHLVVEGLEGLIALGQPAKIEGSAWVKLGPGHVGQKWGGTPG
jgi:hypothetical protein